MNAPIIEYWEQGSLDWVHGRLGRPTASNLSRLITQKCNQAGGKGVQKYAAELTAEHFSGEPYLDFKGEWMERGQALEPDALRHYQYRTELEVEKIGLIYADESRMFAASPDGLVQDDGGLELKCPALPQHLMYLALDDIPDDYVPQVQGALWASGREWWDFMSYHPGYPSLLVRCTPIKEWQEAITEYVPPFIDTLMEWREKISSLGVVAPD